MSGKRSRGHNTTLPYDLIPLLRQMNVTIQITAKLNTFSKTKSAELAVLLLLLVEMPP